MRHIVAKVTEAFVTIDFDSGRDITCPNLEAVSEQIREPGGPIWERRRRAQAM